MICEEKHMGSRAIVIVCRSSEVAQRRFVPTDAAGLAVTRTGRRFFSDPALERAVLERVSNAVADAGLWEELETDWLLLDAELCPGPQRRTSCSDRSTRRWVLRPRTCSTPRSCRWQRPMPEGFRWGRSWTGPGNATRRRTRSSVPTSRISGPWTP